MQRCAPILEALDGLAYVTNFSGDMLSWTQRWGSFARENGAERLTDAHGLNTLSSCSDPETARAYQSIYCALQSGRLDSYSFGLRCDTPRLRRQLRMSLSRLVLDGEPVGILHQCITVAETERPPIGLLENPLGRPGHPFLRMCSYCLKVLDEAESAWIEAEDYYRRGGDSDVQITHGICPSCHQAIVGPILN